MSSFVVRDFVGMFPLRVLVQNPWVDPATGEAGCDSMGTIEVNGVQAVVVFTDERWARRFLTATGFNRAGGEIGRFDLPEPVANAAEGREDRPDIGRTDRCIAGLMPAGEGLHPVRRGRPRRRWTAAGDDP